MTRPVHAVEAAQGEFKSAAGHAPRSLSVSWLPDASRAAMMVGPR